MDKDEAKTLAGELVAELDARAARLQVLQRYYRGDHPLPLGAPERPKREYRQLLKKSRANFMALVVSAVTERLQVVGFRASAMDQDGDDAAWRIWQANKLDRGQRLLYAKALSLREGYTIVWPRGGGQLPRISLESPLQVIVRWDDDGDRKLAAVKAWKSRAGYRNVTLYTDDFVWKWQTAEKTIDVALTDGADSSRATAVLPVGLTGGLVPRLVTGEPWPLPNPLKMLPVVEFQNRPDLDAPPMGEFEDLTDIQDRINETIFARMLAMWFSAFRQKWLTGLEIPEDPETGEPMEPFNAAVDRLWMAEDAKAQFGEFSESDITLYLKAAEADIVHLGAISQTPPNYLLGQIPNLPAEAFKAAEAGLIGKCLEKQDGFGESWEETMSLAFRAAGDTARADAMDSQVIWRNPAYRTEGELVDALVKMSTIGVPHEALWERWGASPQEIERWKGMQADALTRVGAGDFAALAAGLKPPAPPTPPALPGDAGVVAG